MSSGWMNSEHLTQENPPESRRLTKADRERARLEEEERDWLETHCHLCNTELDELGDDTERPHEWIITSEGRRVPICRACWEGE